MLILGIESTCDEAACAIVRDGQEVLSSVIASQIDLHSTYGGVVPELACRRHVDVLIPTLHQALKEAGVTLQDIDGIAVARGPGLIGALLIGINAAKALSLALKKPIVGINHIEAHLYAALMSHDKPPPFPALGLVASGGHSTLAVMNSVGDYTVVGSTVDDAVGEAFDKAAKILGLPYPGGPEIEKLAQSGDPTRYSLRAGNVKGKDLSFSFSGLKTAVLYAVKGPKAKKDSPTLIDGAAKADVAAAFQEAALGDLVSKAVKACERYHCKAIVGGGGVTSSRRLKSLFADATTLPTLWPKDGLAMDNAAMIAGLGYHRLATNPLGDGLAFEAATRIPLGE